jgi:anti-sigma regulatory factor (Ser/Thr protein kinase)
MVRRGVLEASGHTREREYRLAIRQKWSEDLPVAEMEEDTVWRLEILPLLHGLKQNVLDVCQVGFTEMLNNVIDHSSSVHASVGATLTAAQVTLFVSDQGIGIFEKLQRDHGFDDPRHAVLELSKGKLTSNPEAHSGQGIFFTSRMFDSFTIRAGNLVLACADDDNWLLEAGDERNMTGTYVMMTLAVDSEKTTKQIFDRFAGVAHDFSFSKTHVPVSLMRYGTEQLVSRSQARRLLARFDKFREISLDFRNVAMIGQPFADEIFRVFRTQHPTIDLIPLFESQDIRQVIRSVQGELPERLQIYTDPTPDDPYGFRGFRRDGN